MCGRPAGRRVLADRARLGRPGSRLPLHVSVAGLGGGYRGGRPPTVMLAAGVMNYFEENVTLQR